MGVGNYASFRPKSAPRQANRATEILIAASRQNAKVAQGVVPRRLEFRRKRHKVINLQKSALQAGSGRQAASRLQTAIGSFFGPGSTEVPPFPKEGVGPARFYVVISLSRFEILQVFIACLPRKLS